MSKGRLESEDPITAPLTREKALWCWSESLTNSGLVETNILAAKDVRLVRKYPATKIF